MKKVLHVRWIWLLLWLGGILFPLGAMRRVSGGWQNAIDRTFSGEWRHIAMHLFLFAGLVLLLFALFHLPWSRRGLLFGGLVVLAVGGLQEIIQAAAGASAATWSGAVFDLGVDLGGGAIGAGLWGLTLWLRKK